MSDNAKHPVFVKDARLREEFDDWVHSAGSALPDIPQKRQLLASLDQTNHIADGARDSAIADLDKLDASQAGQAAGVNSPAAALSRRATPQDKAYENGRADIMSRFTEVNDRLWKQRETFGNQLDTLLDRHNIKRDTQRSRLPTIIQQSRPVTDRQSYLDTLKTRAPSPATTRQQDRGYENE